MRCVSVIGPSQSGKSTLAAALAGGTAKPQPVDISEEVGLFRTELSDEPWSVIDCPGSIEFLPQCRNALLASDAAIVCVSWDPASAVLAAPFLLLADQIGIPTLIFVNKVDEMQGRIRDTVSALQEYCGHTIVLRQIPTRTDGRVTGSIDLVSERAWRYREQQPSALVEIPADTQEREHAARSELLEELSDMDDWLLEEFLEDREPPAGPVFEICSRILREGKVMPAFLGSALHGNGITRLTKAMRHEIPGVDRLRERLAATVPASDGALSAVAFGATRRKHLGKTTFLRVLGGGVANGARLGTASLGAVTVVGGDNGAGAAPGDIVSAVKSDHLALGSVLTAEEGMAPETTEAPPAMLTTVLVASNERDETRLMQALETLAEVDPGMSIEREEATGRPLVHLQGPLHARRLRKVIEAEFGIETEEIARSTGYRETITKTVSKHYRHRKQSGGAGQFADVQLTVGPAMRGDGLVFAETIKGGAVPRNYIPAVGHGAADAMESGPLGLPVVDVEVTLTDGKHHSVDSSDFAFRTAGRMGVGEALAEAAPVLLQPIHSVEVHVPSAFSGALMPIVTGLGGQVLGFDRDPARRGWDVFRALLPAGVLAKLPHSLRSATQGTGYFEASLDHYEELYGQEATRILAEIEAAHA